MTVNDQSGDRLAKQILSILRESGINVDNLIGHGYDAASAMYGQFHGVQAIQGWIIPLRVLYIVLLNAHALNLTTSKASEVQVIRNAFGVMAEVVTFFRSSGTRKRVLERLISESKSQIAGKQLKRICVGLEKHDAAKTFRTLFTFIIGALEEISQWHDSASTMASTFLLVFYCQILLLDY